MLPYDRSGRVEEKSTYFKEGNDWVFKAKMSYRYTGNKIANIRQESTFNSSGTIYDYDLVWEGENISSITSRFGPDVWCIQNYSYDLGSVNPMRRCGFLYFGDGDASATVYKLPFYFSKNMMTKSESVWPSAETVNYKYTFTNTGLVKTFFDASGVRWAYDYSCP